MDIFQLCTWLRGQFLSPETPLDTSNLEDIRVQGFVRLLNETQKLSLEVINLRAEKEQYLDRLESVGGLSFLEILARKMRGRK